MIISRTLFCGLGLWCAVVALAGEPATPPGIRKIWCQDFDNLAGVNQVKELTWGDNRARLVKRGPDGGMCLEVSTLKPKTICAVDMRHRVRVEPHLVLAFDHREEIIGTGEAAYFGLSFYSGGKQGFWHSDRFTSEWRHVEIPITQLRERYGVKMKQGLVLDWIQLYGRSKDKTQRGDNPLMMKVWLDNICLLIDPGAAPIYAGKAYTCHNNPPLLDWGGKTVPGTRLQYSMDERFRDATTTNVTLASTRPFYVPPHELTPGTWFFRRQRPGDDLQRWSAIEKVVIPEQAHHYRLPPFDPAALRRLPHPRLLPRIRPDGKPVDASERRQLVKQAEAMLKQGVPKHPGPYKKGDPRWPNWIDWYGKVAGQVTARTGSRLTKAARAAILTRDPRAIAAAKGLLLAACEWDPDGGSSARRGDLQAATLLKGMMWCYDGCESTLNEAEHRVVDDVLRRRVLQFYTGISPFRLNPAQNHPWKRNTIVAESALVLIGDFPEAEEWLDVSVHNFCYRILPSMGFQGENQEGISYWVYGVNMLANFAELMLEVAGLNLYDHPWLRQTCRFPIYLAPPDAYAISFADNSYHGNASYVGPCGTRLVGLLGMRTHDPYALWYANRATKDTDFRAPADLPQSIFYPFIGYSLFHTCLSEGLDSVDVGMRSGPYYAGHQHDDNNGFVIHAYGDKLAVDGGYYDWYGSPHFKAYSQKTLAHNTLLVDGRNQTRGTSGATPVFFDSPSFGYALGDAGSNPKIYGGRLRRFDRRLIFLKPAFVVVHDLVESRADTARLDWLLHAHTKLPFAADSSSRTFAIVRPRARLDGCFLAPKNLDLQVKKSFHIGPQKPRESVFLPESEVQPEWTMFARPKTAAKTTEFLAVMQVRRHDDQGKGVDLEPLESPRLRGCRIEAPYGRYVFVTRKAGAAPGVASLAGLETDGVCAAVLLHADGTPRDAFAIGATVLRFDNATLWKNPVRGNWAMEKDGTVEAPPGILFMDGKRRTMAGRTTKLPGGDMTTWWTTISSTERRPCEVTVKGWTGKRPPHIRLGGQTSTGTKHVLPLSDTPTCLTLTGSGTFDAITVVPRRFTTIPAGKVPKDFAPAAADIVIDANDPGPVAQSTTKGESMKKVAALGGSAFCRIDGPVQWAEWDFTVPTAGTFEILVRAASEYSIVERQIFIDGKSIPAADTCVRMPGTGGWCRQTDDWAWSVVNGADGTRFTLPLASGKHTLRWEFVVGSQNVDQFVLRRVKP